MDIMGHFVGDLNRAWPFGIVPYEFTVSLQSPLYLPSDLTAPPPPHPLYPLIQQAIAHWNNNTNVRLVPRDNPSRQPNYIFFVDAPTGPCASEFVGMNKGIQKIFLNLRAAEILAWSVGGAQRCTP